MHKVFITGSSIVCALGNNKNESINKLKNLNNKNYKETAYQYGVSYTQVYQWTQKYLKEGKEGLLDKRGKRKVEETLSIVERQERRIKQLEQLTQKLQKDNEILKKVRSLEAEMLRSQGIKK